MENKDIEYLKKYLPSDKYEEGLRRLNSGEAVQYIVGNVDFYGNNIIVNKSVLIPRFETELLVEKTIKLIKKYFTKKVDILDIGTGSGCIAITLNKNVLSSVVGVDISQVALSVAEENNKVNATDVKFYKSDVFTNVRGKFDVIISNPPYIDPKMKIMDVVYNNEPHTSLFAPNKGLYFYDKILKEASGYLKDNYLIAFEIGCEQAKDIVNMANEYLPLAKAIVMRDYSNRDRFIFISNMF